MTTFEIGEAFEDWCLDTLFLFNDKNGFTLLDKNVFCKHKVKSNEKPDFELFCNKHQMKFYIECKYLHSTDNFYNSKTIDSKYYQNLNHMEISRKHPVFYLYGIGGEPRKPKYLYLVPFRLIKTKIKVSHIRMFSVNPKRMKSFNDLLTT